MPAGRSSGTASSRFPSAGLVLAALRTVHSLCQDVGDRQNVCLQLHARLHQVFLRINSCAKHGSLAPEFELSCFTRLVASFRQALEQHRRLRNMVHRMLATRRLMVLVRYVHHELSDLLTAWKLASSASALHRWKDQLALNQRTDDKKLHATLGSLLSTTTFLTKEYTSERRQAQLLMELVCEFAPTRERCSRQSPLLLESLKMVHKRVSTFSGLHVRRVPRWFLPSSEVEFATSKQPMIGHGAWATTLYRGEFYPMDAGQHQPTGIPVAIKCFWALKDLHYDVVERLLHECGQLWWSIRHAHIVPIRGASHAANPPYIVRDYTTYGSLTSYLTALKTRTTSCSSEKLESITWQLLYGASKGLIYLHEQKQLAHGGLRCNNILVNKHGQAVIADYGLHAFATEARKLHLHHVSPAQVWMDNEDRIRWLAPEILKDDQHIEATRAAFAADVYAFGMCILEVFTKAAPWENMELADVLSAKIKLRSLPPRPSGMQDEVWTLIEQMCAANPSQRLTLRQVSAELKRFGYSRKTSELQVAPSRDDDSAVEADDDDISETSRVSDGSSFAESDNQLGHLASPSALRDQEAQYLESNQQLQQDLPVEIEALELSSPLQSPAEYETSEREPSGIETTEQESGQSAMEPSGLTNMSSQLNGQSLLEMSVSQDSDFSAQQESGVPSESASDIIDRISKFLESGPVINAAPASMEIFRPVPNVSKYEQSKGSETILIEHESLKLTGLQENGSKSKQPSAIESVSAAEASIAQASESLDVASLHRESSKRTEANDEPERIVTDAVIDGFEYISQQESIEAQLNVPSGSLAKQTIISSTKANEKLLEESAQQPTFSPLEAVRSKSECSMEPAQEPEISATSTQTDDKASKSQVEDDLGGDINFLRPSLEDDNSVAKEVAGHYVPASSTTQIRSLIQQIEECEQSSNVLTALEQLYRFAQGNKVPRIVECNGIPALLQVVRSGVCVRHALEVLHTIVGHREHEQTYMDVMIASDGVTTVLAALALQLPSEDVDFTASFLLEMLVCSDEAKQTLWAIGGITTVENNSSIDRRLIQEIKAIIAKFKRSEGNRCLIDNDYALAIERFSEAISLDRRRGIYYCDRSLAYYQASMFQKAADDAAKSMRYNPYDVTGYLRHALALKSLGKYTEAIVSLRKGRQVDPTYAKIKDVLVEVEALRNGSTQPDGPGLKKVSRAEAAKLKKKDGDDMLRKRNYSEAIQHYTDAIMLDAENDWLYLHRSIAYAGCGNYANAAEDASRCVQLNYRQIEGYYRLAIALNALEQYDDALSTLYRSQEIDPRHSGVTRLIAQLEDEAAARANLSLCEWLKEKGYRAFQLRAFEEAVAFYTKAIQASPCDHDELALHCFFYRARANQSRGEFAAVIADCTHLLSHNPQNVFARLRRADAYEQLREYACALEDMREIVSMSPEYEDARARLHMLEQRCKLLRPADQ